MTQTWLASAQREMQNTQPNAPLNSIGSLFGPKPQDFGMPKSDKKWRKMDQAAHISMSTEAETQAVGATRSLR